MIPQNSSAECAPFRPRKVCHGLLSLPFSFHFFSRKDEEEDFETAARLHSKFDCQPGSAEPAWQRVRHARIAFNHKSSVLSAPLGTQAMKELQANSEAGISMLCLLSSFSGACCLSCDRVRTLTQVDPRWRRGVDDAVMIVKQNYGTTKASTMMSNTSACQIEMTSCLHLPKEWEANLLLESAKAASEVRARSETELARCL